MSRAQELADSIVHRFLTLGRYRRYVSNLINTAVNLSGRDLATLRYLAQGGPRTVSQIGRMLYVRDATVSPMLERLEREGYVTRTRCREDARKVMVEVTTKGREIINQAPLGPVWLMRTHLPELPIEELEEIDHALARLSDIAGVDESLL